jgi:hypothetical protein
VVPRCAGPVVAARRRTRPGSRSTRPAEPPPLIRGHSWARQRAISTSSRSMARRAGRCTLQSSRRSRRHTWPGWKPTPTSRSITTATRRSVHSWVSNPNTCGPSRRACSTAPNSAADSRGGGRPARRRVGPARRHGATAGTTRWQPDVTLRTCARPRLGWRRRRTCGRLPAGAVAGRRDRVSRRRS